jgi:hypothetical protein
VELVMAEVLRTRVQLNSVEHAKEVVLKQRFVNFMVLLYNKLRLSVPLVEEKGLQFLLLIDVDPVVDKKLSNLLSD